RSAESPAEAGKIGFSAVLDRTRTDDDRRAEVRDVDPGRRIELREPLREKAHRRIGRLRHDRLVEAGSDLDEALDEASLVFVGRRAPDRLPSFVSVPEPAGIEEARALAERVAGVAL